MEKEEDGSSGREKFRNKKEGPSHTSTDHPFCSQKRSCVLSNKFVIPLTNLITSYMLYGEEEEHIALCQGL